MAYEFELHQNGIGWAYLCGVSGHTNLLYPFYQDWTFFNIMRLLQSKEEHGIMESWD